MIVATAVVAPALRPPVAQAAGDSLVGQWRLDRAASGDVRRAIDTATGRMNFFIRPIARSRLRSANEVHEHLALTITATEVATRVDRSPPIASPANGTPVTWVRENGDVFQLHTVVTGQRLVQTFIGRDGSSRENVFAPGADGRTLNVAVTVAHPRLPMPVTYRLVYRRDDAAH
ncbi:MAG TPA: hypothetical protein VGD56_16935 [Gemmatirosa sp.]